MSASVTDFIGTIPFYYDQYLAPLIIEPYGPELARRISAPSGGAVLEIAAGTGSAARHLRNVLGDVERSGLPVEEAVKSVERAVGEAHDYRDVRAPMQALLFKAQRQGH